jgi:hypothetical protein
MSGYDGSLPPDEGGWYFWNTTTNAWTATTGDDDPHADCIQPHPGPDGEHHDCDGRPL